ncbi:MAG: tetratricopeptide repeat protein, partial [Desulfobaccales bacterium]
MALSRRWLIALLPPVFLVLVLILAYMHDPHFYLDPETLYLRAKEAEKQGQLDQALIMAQKSWKRSPENSDCGQFLGWLYLKQGKPEPALEILQPLWNRDPTATSALKGVAQALHLMGRRPEALELLRNFLKDNPDEAEVLLFAAQLSGQREEERTQAIEYYQQHYR